jgi:hypothetical protein
VEWPDASIHSFIVKILIEGSSGAPAPLPGASAEAESQPGEECRECEESRDETAKTPAREERASQAACPHEPVRRPGKRRWYGHVTHVQGGERKYVKELDEITDFIRPYLAEGGVEFGFSWRMRKLLRGLGVRGVRG